MDQRTLKEVAHDLASELHAGPLGPGVDAAIVRFIIAQQAWDKLHQFVSTQAFLEHMNRAGPVGGATAIAIEHAASIMAGHSPDLEATKDTYQVACTLFGDAGREVVCRELSVLRNRLAREPALAWEARVNVPPELTVNEPPPMFAKNTPRTPPTTPIGVSAASMMGKRSSALANTVLWPTKLR